MLRLLSYLFDFVIAFLFAKVLSKAIQALTGGGRVHIKTSPGETPSNPSVHSGQTARDPVCGMFVSTEVSHQIRSGDEVLHFCSRECLERYQKDSAHVHS